MKKQYNFFLLLIINFLIVTFIFNNCLLGKWRSEKQNIGEGIPAFQAVSESNDKSFSLWIEHSTDEYCIPLFFIKSNTKIKFKYERDKNKKMQKTLMQFPSGRKYIFKGYAINHKIYELNVDIKSYYSMLNSLSKEKKFEIINNTIESKIVIEFDLVDAFKAAVETCEECEKSFLNENNYVFLDSDKRLLKEGEIINIPQNILSIARNEIYARHGYIFRNKKYADYFKNKKWYKPVNKKVTLSKIEAPNARLLISVENNRR